MTEKLDTWNVERNDAELSGLIARKLANPALNNVKIGL